MDSTIDTIQIFADTVDTAISNTQLPQDETSSAIYAVMWVTLILWGGLFAYLFYLDRQVKKVKNKIDIEES